MILVFIYPVLFVLLWFVILFHTLKKMKRKGKLIDFRLAKIIFSLVGLFVLFITSTDLYKALQIKPMSVIEKEQIKQFPSVSEIESHPERYKSYLKMNRVVHYYHDLQTGIVYNVTPEETVEIQGKLNP